MRLLLKALILNPRSGYTNKGAIHLHEYNHRAKMRRIGYTEDIENLDAYNGEIFAHISDEISKLEKESMDRKSKRGK